MGTFENAGKTADQLVESASNTLSKTADNAEKSTLDGLIGLSRSSGDFLKNIGDGLKSIGSSVANAHGSAIESTVSAMEGFVEAKNSAINGANEAIASVSQMINDFQKSIDSGLAIIKKEGGKYYAEVKNEAGETVKMSMERTTSTGKEVLANVNGKWQYVKDVGGDYASKLEAASKVVYNNTLKPVGDVVAATGKAVGKAYKEGKRQYDEELNKIQMASRGVPGNVRSGENDPRRIDNPELKPKEYTVKSGDTLSKIALAEVGLDKSKVGEYLKKVVDANNGINPNKIAVGQKINLPKVA